MTAAVCIVAAAVLVTVAGLAAEGVELDRHYVRAAEAVVFGPSEPVPRGPMLPRAALRCVAQA